MEIGTYCPACGRNHAWDRGPSPTEAIQVDPDLLESQLRIARMMSHGPLTSEPGE